MAELCVITFAMLFTLFFLLQEVQHLRQSRETMTCLGHLRQLGMAFHLYESENQGKFPFPNYEPDYGRQITWYNAIDPYLIRRTAATNISSFNLHLVKHDPIIRRLGPSWHTNSHTLKMNLHLGRSPHDPSHEERYFYSLQEIKKSSQTVLLFDGRAESDTLASGLPALVARNPEGTEGLVARRHSDQANVLFVDGHVELRKEKPQTGGTELGWEVNETGMIWKPWEDSPGH
jgi:prepilin-type processing-associated H-X9-DG protein